MTAVALFVPCICQDICPETALATARALELAGCEVLAPQNQTCCGQPLYKQGRFSRAKKLAKHTIEVFAPKTGAQPLPLVSPSASCTAMLRNYPRLLADEPEWGERATALASRAFELCEFLDVNLPDGFTFPECPATVAYHESCQTRSLGVGDAVRRVLGRVPGLTLLELDDPTACCGFGGSFGIEFPEIGHAVLEDKLASLQAAWNDAGLEGTQRLAATAEIGCMLNIRSGLDSATPGARILHAAHLLTGACT